MAGVPGKNKTERGFRILWNSVDLSGDLLPGTVQGGGITLDEVEMTGVSNTVKNFLGGHGNSPVSAQFYMNDTTSTGAFTVLKAAAGTTQTLELQYGSNGAAPSAGDPEWAGTYVFLGFSVGQNGGKMVMTCNFQPAAGSAAPAWGSV